MVLSRVSGGTIRLKNDIRFFSLDRNLFGKTTISVGSNRSPLVRIAVHGYGRGLYKKKNTIENTVTDRRNRIDIDEAVGKSEL